MFEPIRTRRLLIRAVDAGDVDPLLARRNDPAVARHQHWTLPFDRERAEELIAGAMAMDGPANDEWWMATVCDATSGAVLGDLAVRLTWEGRTAAIGYTFAAEHWGQGYAVEAVEALVEWLFDVVGVSRIWGNTDPDNRASTMVLERVGMLYEGRTRGSYWVGEVQSDDVIYGMVGADWRAWRERPPTPPTDVRLAEIDAENVERVYEVASHHSQRHFVAPVEWSFADALVPEIVDGAPLVPWMRAVVADDAIVGFVMLALVTEQHPEPLLWRLLIDRLHQRRGLGRRVLDLVAEECRSMGYDTLLTSWVEGKGSPRDFYERYGFVPTGRIVDDETEARITLASSATRGA